MAEEFTPITTQEAFDAAVADRLAPYADYDEIKAQNTTYAGQIEQLNGRIKAYETNELKTRVAHETGIPFDLAQRLTGTTEAEIRKDAQSLAKLLKPPTPPAPGKTAADDGSGGSKKAALRAFTNQLMNKE